MVCVCVWRTYTAGPLQTRMSWCGQTGQWGWAAAPQSHSWCSDWRSSSEHATAWTSPASASPTVSPSPPLRSQRKSWTQLWPAQRQTSSQSCKQNKKIIIYKKKTLFRTLLVLFFLQEKYTFAHLVSSVWVRMSRQLTITAESLPVRETFTVDIHQEIQSKEAHEHTDRGRADLTKERNPVSDKSCQLTEQAGKDRQWEKKWTWSSRENKDELRKAKQRRGKIWSKYELRIIWKESLTSNGQEQ